MTRPLTGGKTALTNLMFVTKKLKRVLEPSTFISMILTISNINLYQMKLIMGFRLAIHIVTETSVVLPDQFQGFGTVHHMAFRTEDAESLNWWIKRIQGARLAQSGLVDRFYFKSEYFRPGRGVLFEIATDGPGFLLDETYEEAGVHLELPPFLEDQREDIEEHLVDFNTEQKTED
ncbi:VOC family protein [Pediococcus inopinatus]|nr:VOC family protein [Pediococcus inopinatus]WPP10077.1 VOC family protein [Pediococcus inopinatus]